MIPRFGNHGMMIRAALLFGFAIALLSSSLVNAQEQPAAITAPPAQDLTAEQTPAENVPPADAPPPAASDAQSAEASAPAATGTPDAAPPDEKLIAKKEEDISPTDIPSLLFTYWEYTALQDAKKTRGVVRAPTETELMEAVSTPTDQPTAGREPGIRELSLGGIVYKDKNDWSIWFNNTMITPKALPKEAIDLVVRKDYIDVKWYDAYTNQIFPVRLRPHQRFNLDARLFLPGEG